MFHLPVSLDPVCVNIDRIVHVLKQCQSRAFLSFFSLSAWQAYLITLMNGY